MIRDRRALKRTALALVFLLALEVVNLLWGEGKVFWLNLTGSEPLGVYRLENAPGPIKRGDLVLITVPKEFDRYLYGRRWLPRGWSLLKNVGALPGDIYCIRESALFINNIWIGPVYAKDRNGFPLPQLKGCQEVPVGQFLPVATRIRRSFDGRYMGPLDISLIKGIVRPVATF